MNSSYLFTDYRTCVGGIPSRSRTEGGTGKNTTFHDHHLSKFATRVPP